MVTWNSPTSHMPFSTRVSAGADGDAAGVPCSTVSTVVFAARSRRITIRSMRGFTLLFVGCT